MTSGVCIDDESDVLGRLIRGDPSAFNFVFEQHFEPLTRFVARMVDSQHVAAELVQDVFLRVWSGRSMLQVRGDLRSYLRRAARNRALDWLRREALHRAWEESSIHEASIVLESGGPEPDTMEELREVLTRMLSIMPQRRRAVCELRWHEGLGPSAIAKRLGVSVKTVESHLTRGLSDMRAAFVGIRREQLPAQT